MKKLSLLVLVLLLVLFYSFPLSRDVFACDPVEPPSTQQENFQDADAVFLGVVIDSDVVNYDTYSRRATTTFEVSKYWKGNVEKNTITVSESDGMCGWGIPKLGEEYLIYGRYSSSTDSYYLGSFSGNKLLSSASSDISALGKGKIPNENKKTLVAYEDYFFTRNLRFGMVGEDVRQLQKYLNHRDFKVSFSGYGSSGNETTYFGPATRAALVRFQTVYASELGISWGTGYFGPLTRTLISGQLSQ